MVNKKDAALSQLKAALKPGLKLLSGQIRCNYFRFWGQKKMKHRRFGYLRVIPVRMNRYRHYGKKCEKIFGKTSRLYTGRFRVFPILDEIKVTLTDR